MGHASDYDGLTGCTAILCESGAVAGGDIRGSATGTEEWDCSIRITSPNAFTRWCSREAAHSVWKPPAACGASWSRKASDSRLARRRCRWFRAAILYDLGLGKSDARPTREMGEAAAAAATDGPVAEGAVGAGTGATVGKLLGMKQAMKSGMGSWTVELGGQCKGVLVAALAVVNAVGDVRDPATRKIIAGARKAAGSDNDSMEFADSVELMKQGRPSGFARSNTTLVAVATNARLDKAQAAKLAQFAQLGIARAIDPVNTMSDGDAAVALSIGDAQAPIDSLGVAAAEAVAEAILRAVRLAPSLGGLPGLKN